MSRGQRGEVSITAVLVASTLLVVILAATLSLFEGFVAKAGDATRRTDAEDVARTAADRVARDLRNIASPTTIQPQAVDLLASTDLVFRTVNPVGPASAQNTTNTQRVRYCLDTARRRLQRQTQTWTGAAIPAVPSVASCPGSGWAQSTVAASNVVNGAVPLFSYDTTDPIVVSTVHVDLLVDTDIVREPPPTRLSTGVFLRNQNRRPVARFTATKAGAAVVLNGSASTDTDNDRLDFKWFVDGVERGAGITFTYTPSPAWAAGSGHTIKLRVSDPADLFSETTQAVTG